MEFTAAHKFLDNSSMFNSHDIHHPKVSASKLSSDEQERQGMRIQSDKDQTLAGTENDTNKQKAKNGHQQANQKLGSLHNKIQQQQSKECALPEPTMSADCAQDQQADSDGDDLISVDDEEKSEVSKGDAMDDEVGD